MTLDNVYAQQSYLGELVNMDLIVKKLPHIMWGGWLFQENERNFVGNNFAPPFHKHTEAQNEKR